MQEKSNNHSLANGLARKPYTCPSLIKHQDYSTSMQIQTVSVTGNSVDTTFGTENYFGD